MHTYIHTYLRYLRRGVGFRTPPGSLSRGDSPGGRPAAVLTPVLPSGVPPPLFGGRLVPKDAGRSGWEQRSRVRQPHPFPNKRIVRTLTHQTKARPREVLAPPPPSRSRPFSAPSHQNRARISKILGEYVLSLHIHVGQIAKEHTHFQEQRNERLLLRNRAAVI